MVRFLVMILGMLLLVLGVHSPTFSQTGYQLSLTELEQVTYEQVNQYRSSQGLAPLQLHSQITEQARIHSQQMATGSVPFSHNGFDSRIAAIASQLPYQKAAENVAYNQGYNNPAQEAVEGWIKSPGHQQNLVGQFDFTGLGVAKNPKGEYYFTQIFILKR